MLQDKIKQPENEIPFDTNAMLHAHNAMCVLDDEYRRLEKRRESIVHLNRPIDIACDLVQSIIGIEKSVPAFRVEIRRMDFSLNLYFLGFSLTKTDFSAYIRWLGAVHMGMWKWKPFDCFWYSWSDCRKVF